MQSNYSIKGTALDTRIQHSILTDARLQADLTAEEFRAFINLTVWLVSLVSDGVFLPDRSKIVTNLAGEHLNRFLELGLVDECEGGLCIVPAYWSWQSSRADLERLAEKRRKATERKAKERQASANPSAGFGPPHGLSDHPPEQQRGGVSVAQRASSNRVSAAVAGIRPVDAEMEQ
jgi:hypothetical protein